MNLYESVKTKLNEEEKKSLAPGLEEYKEFRRQVYSDFEQYEENMMDDDTDVFGGTEDSYANEMIWEHLSDTVYYLLNKKFDTDEAFKLTDIFTEKLIDAYNENTLDNEIMRVFATYKNGLTESEKPLNELEIHTVDNDPLWKAAVEKVNAEYEEARPEIIKGLKAELRVYEKLMKKYGLSEEEIKTNKIYRAYQDAIKDPNDIWCECDKDYDAKYKESGNSYLGVEKDGYLCPACMKFKQIG